MKRIYHGSTNIIEKPTFGIGKVRNDYGLGFYCTEDINLAKEWGASRDKNGYANIYEINDDELTSLNLNSPNYSVLHWLSILLENRIFDTTTPLAKEAKEYRIGDILRATEGDLAPIYCLTEDGECDRQKSCRTYSFWKGLDDVINEYIDSKTLQDLIK